MKMKWACGCWDDGYVYPTEFYPCATHRRAFYRNRIDAALKEVAAAIAEASVVPGGSYAAAYWTELIETSEILARALRALGEICPDCGVGH